MNTVPTIIPFARTVSNTSTFVRATRTEAITAALTGGSPNSVVYDNILRIWPEIANYSEPNNGDFGGPDPSFIWDSTNFIQGERLGFAALINVPKNTQFILNLIAFADNAHTAHVEVYRDDGLLLQNISTELMDGNMDAGTQEAPPYNWQKVRAYSKYFQTANVDPEPLKLIVSFEVQNYLNNGNPPTTNPAALAFLIDLYRINA